MTTSMAAGLTAAEVAERVARGEINDVPIAPRAVRRDRPGQRLHPVQRDHRRAVRIIVLVAGSRSRTACSACVIVANSAIGIIQELRAKQTLDSAARSSGRPNRRSVVRTALGRSSSPSREIVLDDVVELGTGDKVVVDGDLLAEANLEIDESLLTGEADPIVKDAGDKVMSGSFVVAGAGAYRPPRWAGRPTRPSSPRRPASSPWSTPSCAPASTASCSSSPTCWCRPRRPADHLSQLFTTKPAGAIRCDGWSAASCRWSPRAWCCSPRWPSRRRGPAGPPAVPGAGAAGHRGPGPRRRGLRRQDRHAHRGRHAGERSRRNSAGNAQQVRDALASLAAADPRPNASMLAIGEAYASTRPAGPRPRRRRSPRPASGAASSFGEHGNWVLGAPDVLLRPAPGDRRGGRARSAPRACGCCCWRAATGAVDAPDAPGQVTPDRPGDARADGCAPTPATPWPTSPTSRSRSRSSPATTRSRSARSPRARPAR